MMKAIQGPATESGQLLIRAECAGAVTKGQCAAFDVSGTTGALTHRNYVSGDNQTQQLVWGIATESGAVGEMVTFVLKGVVEVTASNLGGNIAAGDPLTRRDTAGYANAVVKAGTGDIILSSGIAAVTASSASTYINWDGIQARYTTA